MTSSMQIAVGDWGIQPSEFWAMPICDWWAIFDHKYVQSQRMNDKDYVPKSEWDEAHKRHKEKMNGRT